MSRALRATAIGIVGMGAAILGIAACSKAKAARGRPRFLEEAFARMRDERKPGLVLRIPNDPEQREALGKTLVSCVDGRAPSELGTFDWPGVSTVDLALHELLLEAVFVCLEPGEIDRWLSGVPGEETLILVDADGAFRAGESLALGKRTGRDEFLYAARRLIHGEGNARLRERSEECQRSAPLSARPALERYLTAPTIAKTDPEDLLELAATLREKSDSLSGGSVTIGSADPTATFVGGVDPSLSIRDARELLEASAPLIPHLILRRVENGPSPAGWRARALLETHYQLAAQSTRVVPYGMSVGGTPTFSWVWSQTNGARTFVGFMGE